MNKKAAPPAARGRSPAKWYFMGGVLAVALATFILFAHPFLAVTRPVDADILVMEGWIPAYMSPATVQEFHRGKYSLLLLSELQNDPAVPAVSPSDTERRKSQLEALGIPRDSIIACPAPFARWLRTSKTARAVRNKIAELDLKPKGMNVITAGPHARETWVAYQHIFGDAIPIGIISIPKNNYPADRWWMSRQGLIWVPKDFIAWLKEVIFGLRS